MISNYQDTEMEYARFKILENQRIFNETRKKIMKKKIFKRNI